MSRGRSTSHGPTRAPRSRDAWLWQVQQRLIAPAHAIIGYAEIAREEARCRMLDGPGADIERILTAARDLGASVAGLVSARRAGRAASDDRRAGAKRKLRHELRTPLNAIIGYS